MPLRIIDDLDPGGVGVVSNLKKGANTVDDDALDTSTADKRRDFLIALDIEKRLVPDISSLTSSDSGRWAAYDHSRGAIELATFAASTTISAREFDVDNDRQRFDVRQGSITSGHLDADDTAKKDAFKTLLDIDDNDDRITPRTTDVPNAAVGTFESIGGDLRVRVDDQDSSNVVHGVAGTIGTNRAGISQNIAGVTDTGIVTDSGLSIYIDWLPDDEGIQARARVPKAAFPSQTATTLLDITLVSSADYIDQWGMIRWTAGDTTDEFGYQSGTTGVRFDAESGTPFTATFFTRTTAQAAQVPLPVHRADRWESYKDVVVPKTGGGRFTAEDKTNVDNAYVGSDISGNTITFDQGDGTTETIDLPAQHTAADIRTLLGVTAQQFNDMFVNAEISGRRITFTQKAGSLIRIDIPSGGGDGGSVSQKLQDIETSIDGDGWTNTSGDTTMVAAVSRPQAVRRTTSNVASVAGGYGFSQGTGGSELTNNYIYLRIPVAQSDLSLNAHRAILEDGTLIGDAATTFHTTATYRYFEFQPATIAANSTIRAQTFSKLSQGGQYWDWPIVGEPDQDDEVLVADRSTRTRRWQRLDETGEPVIVADAIYPAFTSDVQLPLGDAADSYGAWTEIYRYTATATDKWTFNMTTSFRAGWAPVGGGDRASGNIRLRHMNSANVEQQVLIKPIEPYIRHGPDPYDDTTEYGSVALPAEVDLASGDYILVEGQGGSQQGGTAITGRGTTGDIVAVIVDAAHTSINMRRHTGVPVSPSLIQEQARIERLASVRRFANQADLDAATLLDGQWAYIPA